MFQTQIPDCRWPAIPSDAAAQALALQYQLERTQWWSADEIRHAQFGQLQEVLNEAFRKIAYWRDTLGRAGFEPGGEFSAASFATLPALTRTVVQSLGNRLANPSVSRLHGATAQGSTSGSTGTPVHFYQTELTQHFWRGLTLREHFWQRRDFSGKLAAIRSNVENGEAPNWGAATENVIATGPACALNIRADTAEQMNWLVEHNPHYLLTHPSNLKALAKLAIDRGIALPKLRQLRTFGEVLSDDTRELCRLAWQVGIADVYSSEEAGSIAMQCEHGVYHAQSENLLVEIVDDQGCACAPGEIGRVLITTLHNFAMPLIRYEIGDYAEWASGCRCGRGLPAIRQILGRKRNMLKLPDGTQHWPSFPEDRWIGIAPIQQLQVVQKSLDTVVVKVKSERPLSAAETSRLADTFKATLKFPHHVMIEPVFAITRTKNAKFEDFVSEIT